MPFKHKPRWLSWNLNKPKWFSKDISREGFLENKMRQDGFSLVMAKVSKYGHSISAPSKCIEVLTQYWWSVSILWYRIYDQQNIWSENSPSFATLTFFWTFKTQVTKSLASHFFFSFLPNSCACYFAYNVILRQHISLLAV